MTYSTHSLRYSGNCETRSLVSSIWCNFGSERFTFGDLLRIDGMSDIRAPTVGKWRRENILKRTGYEIVGGKKVVYYKLSPSTIEYIRDYHERSAPATN